MTSIVLSHQHADEAQTSDDIRAIVEPYIREIIPAELLTAKTEWWVNPTGTFVIGGPDGDAGLTGRKIIVDTYGGAAPHGGGAFSGKDPTKVDRSAAYAARYLAKNIVAAGLADKCTLQVSYAIGVAKPLVDLCGLPRHRQDRGSGDRGCDPPRDGPEPPRYPHPSGPEQADLFAHSGLWSLWPRARSGRRIQLGAHRSGRGSGPRNPLTFDWIELCRRGPFWALFRF